MAFQPRVVIGPDGIPVFIEPLPVGALRALDVNNAADLATAAEYVGIYSGDGLNELRLRIGRQIQSFPVNASSPQFKEQLELLAAQTNNKNTLTAAARRLAEQQSANVESGGDYGKKAIYVTEDEPCPACEALAGLDMTYAEFVAEGAVPGAQCYQGDLCRCDLVFYS